MLRRKRGINDGIWNRAVHSLTVVVMMVALAASLMPAPASQAEAAGCPPGQVLNTTGECVPLDLTLDVESEEDQPQIDLKLAGVVEVETPSPQLEPIVVTDEETPTLQLNSDVVTEEVTPTPQPDLGIVDTDVDGTPAADPELTDIPVIDPLSEEPGEGYVTVQKYACGSDPDVYQMTLAELQHDCDLSSEEFMFGLKVDGEDQATVQVTDANGSASWTVPNPTAVTINEAVPAGFGEPIVFCGNSLANLSLHDVTFGGAVSFPLAASEQFHCEWFNVQIGEDEDETGYGYVTVNKFDCGLDPDAYQKPLDGLLLDCSPMEDVAFGLTNEDDADQVIFSEQQVSDAAGIAVWTVPNPSTITISEVIPAGYGEPVVFCVAPQLDPDILPYSAAGGAISIPLAIAPGEQLYCDWFNVQIGEDEEEGGKIWIKKYSCENFPVQSPPDFIDISVFEYYECAELDGVPFAVSDDSVDLIGQSGDSGPGWLKLDGLVSGLVTVTEDIPAGYGEPFVYCATSTGENSYGTVVSVPVQSGAVQLKRDPDQSIFCEWLNIPTGDYEDSDGSIQINKYTCPTGYDLHASGANPYADCTDGANGIEFLLDGASSQVTGQVLFGAVRWEGLSTSTYTVTEDVPLDIGFVFVMSCEGNSIPMIQGFPLSTGPSLDIPLQSGDHIVCSWYNVPAPEGGTVTVIKYACVGEVFVSVDDCQIFEDGQGFALSHFNGSTWEEVAFGTTNAQGVLSFTGLAEGLYQVDEIDGTWCHAVADSTNADGYLVVGIGQETTLQVYNCGVKLLKVPPTTYPNTGAGAQPHSLNLSAAPVLPADAPGMLEPHQWTGVLDSRLIAPFLSGDKPVRVEIEAIGVDAAVETLEIIDGAFQDPTTSDQVAWYKDTARLGEDGNLVMAGHLNYWGDRVGVFFALDQVEKGDEIAVTAEDGTVYRYSVTEVSLQPANSASLQAITQEAGGQTLTLITCGGEWDPASKSYLQRTVLQAELED